jgi:hypothetical protein
LKKIALQTLPRELRSYIYSFLSPFHQQAIKWQRIFHESLSKQPSFLTIQKIKKTILSPDTLYGTFGLRGACYNGGYGSIYLCYVCREPLYIFMDNLRPGAAHITRPGCWQGDDAIGWYYHLQPHKFSEDDEYITCLECKFH